MGLPRPLGVCVGTVLSIILTRLPIQPVEFASVITLGLTLGILAVLLVFSHCIG